MAQRTLTPERIIQTMREAEVELAKGGDVGAVAKGIGVTGRTCYRWRSEYGRVCVDRATCMMELGAEYPRLTLLVMEQALDISIVKDAGAGIS